MKVFLSLWMVLMAVGHCTAQNKQYFPPTTGDEWETMPLEELNWCQHKVDSMVNFVGDNNSKAFIILKDGKIVVEEYYDSFTADSTWYWASAGKTMTAFLVGLAQEQGLLDITDPSSDFLGEGWTSLTPEEEEQITIWNQLTMTTGLDYNTSDLDCTDPECLTFLNEPGEAWYYHNAPYTLLDGVLENATGMGLNLYLFTQLNSSTGITGAYVPVGFNNVLFSKPRSMARFGHLLLNEGTWNGNIVLEDSDYFQAMTTASQDLNEAYGYLTWLNDTETFMMPSTEIVFPGNALPNAPSEVYSAQGKNGQIINIVPSQGLVVVRMGDLPEDGSLVPILFNNLLWEYINELECDPDNVTEQAEIPWTLAPNPTNGTVNITADQFSSYEIFLSDLSGKRVYMGKDKTSLDLSEFSAGIYTVQLVGSQQIQTKRLIIE